MSASGRALMLAAKEREERLRKLIVGRAASGRRVVAWAANAAFRGRDRRRWNSRSFRRGRFQSWEGKLSDGSSGLSADARARELKAADTLVIFSEIWVDAILKQVRQIRVIAAAIWRSLRPAIPSRTGSCA
jgi:hypothetical protein